MDTKRICGDKRVLKNKRPSLLIMASVIAITGAFGLSACKPKEHTKPQVEKTINYDTNTKLSVTTQIVNDTKPMPASFSTLDDTNARARIGGTLVRLMVTEGSFVKQGQLIGIINEPRYDAEVAAGAANAQAGIASAKQAPANLAAARAAANKAAADYNRTLTLYNQGVYAKARLDQMQAANLAASANVRAAEAAVQAANATANAAKSQGQIALAVRNQGYIYAPKSGKVTAVPVTQGTVIMPGEVVAFIASGAPTLKLQMPERDAAYLNIGQDLVIADDNNSPIGTAKVTKIFPQVVNGQIEVELSSQSAEKFIGATTNVLVPLGQKQAIIIPQNYVINRQGNDFVRILQNGKALEIPIECGSIKTNNGVEILSGLNVGDIIVAPQKHN